VYDASTMKLRCNVSGGCDKKGGESQGWEQEEHLPYRACGFRKKECMRAVPVLELKG
jgi:hypothetical protein